MYYIRHFALEMSSQQVYTCDTGFGDRRIHVTVWIENVTYVLQITINPDGNIMSMVFINDYLSYSTTFYLCNMDTCTNLEVESSRPALILDGLKNLADASKIQWLDGRYIASIPLDEVNETMKTFLRFVRSVTYTVYDELLRYLREEDDHREFRAVKILLERMDQ